MERIGRRGRRKGQVDSGVSGGGEGCEGIDIDVVADLSTERKSPLRYKTRRGRGRGRGRRGRGRRRERGVVDIPFEFVGEVAGAGAVAEACDI